MTGIEWTALDYVWLAAFAVAVGIAIGATGIGGVVLAPYLISVAGFPVIVAIATSIAAFIVVGLAGTVIYTRQGAMDWRMAGWLSLGAAPGAWAGSVAVAAIRPEIVATGIAVLMVVTGLNSFRKSAPLFRGWQPGAAAFTLIGLIVGVVSGLSGTGGPVTMVPLLVAIGQPALAIVAVSQIIQIPISGSAIVAHLSEGRIIWPVTIILAIAMAVGLRLGAALITGRDPSVLRLILAGSLVVAGSFLLVRQLMF